MARSNPPGPDPQRPRCGTRRRFRAAELHTPRDLPFQRALPTASRRCVEALRIVASHLSLDPATLTDPSARERMLVLTEPLERLDSELEACRAIGSQTTRPR